MYIITQNLKNRLKNKLSEVVTNYTSEVVDSLSDILINGNEEAKYVELIASIDQSSRELILKIFSEFLHEVDLEFKNSPIRSTYYTVSKSNVSRTITTVFGELTFSRTHYKSRTTGRRIFLLDEELGLVKGDRYDPIVKALAVNNTYETNQKVSGELTGQAISPIANLVDKKMIKTIPRQSVNNWNNKWKVPNFDFEKLRDVEALFVMGDEKFLGCQDLDNDIMVKQIVTFEGVETVSKGRRRLKNRLVYNLVGKNAWAKFTDWLYRHYDSEKLKTIYFMSDGGAWIKSGIDELKVNSNQVVKRLLCEFHYKQAINRMTTDKEWRTKLDNAFKNDTKKNFEKLVKELIEQYSEREEKIMKNFNYINNNRKAIKDMIEFEIGSSMESHISHCLANLFASRPKGYSSKKIEQYLKINDFKNNGISIYNAYLKTYNKDEVITLNSDEINYSIFEKDTSSNMPALNSDRTSLALKERFNNILTANSITL